MIEQVGQDQAADERGSTGLPRALERKLREVLGPRCTMPLMGSQKPCGIAAEWMVLEEKSPGHDPERVCDLHLSRACRKRRSALVVRLGGEDAHP